MRITCYEIGCLSLVATIPAYAQSSPTLAQLAALTTAYEDSQHASPDLNFYRVPANFSRSLSPGTLLQVEYATDLTNYTVPASLSMSRIIYTTKDVHGSIIPASAYILWPYAALPENDSLGYPLVVWAHGTSGLYQPCAPSHYRSLQYHFMVPYLLAEQGHAVVAPDYAGLGVAVFPNGTQFRHAWATTPAQANDMAYAITAARQAFPQYLSANGPFVAMGHSQGGRAAWGFAERQAVNPIAGYRGSIALSPPADAIAQIEQAQANPTAYWAPLTLQLQPMTIDAVTAVYPSYNWTGLTNVTSSIFKDIYAPSQGCLPTQSVLFGGLTLNQLAKPNWTQSSEVRAWQNLTATGRKNFAGPLLIIIGTVDGIIPYNDSVSSSVLSTVQATCDLLRTTGSSESLELVGYQSMNHFSVIQASQTRWLCWIKDRLTLRPVSQRAGCSIGEVAGFRPQDTAQAGPTPNFLVEWANKTNVWQYTL